MKWIGTICVLFALTIASSGCGVEGSVVGGFGGPMIVDEQAYCSEVWNIVNTERAKMSLNSLTRDDELDTIADAHSEVQRNEGRCFHSDGPDGGVADRLVDVGKITWGENVASGQASPASVMDAWMQSPDHRASILSTQFTHLGVGLAMPGYYWTQVLVER